MSGINGLEIVTPSSVVATGILSSATINTNGSISYTNCTSLSLNGIFTSSYHNYVLITRFTSSAFGQTIRTFLRSSGVDSSVSGTYNLQYLQAATTTISTAYDGTTARWDIGTVASSKTEGFYMHLYGPNLTGPTSGKVVYIASGASIKIYNSSINHETSASYDGITLTLSSNDFTGTLSVYGMVM